ncbi:deoxyribodipyrimidine photo-lyase [Natranaerobius trueperi]|uniref:Deoxyribodipyrimidine photo-lyase n=1 Tax=Natranaerobius trueperi TaxID=759412 RepID=A0A226C258_9FIRM|nr:deoxyribodipyrimidine photo-lyase [Natranaerobius trueperi]OWZ84684.1 deoxyribodipyrimidine photolyase [Natranaerobius trueperi]
MQRSQRTHYNHSLEYAINCANENNLSVIVYFGLYDQYPSANLRHFAFMLQGLKDVKENLTKRNIPFIISNEHPANGVLSLAKNAALIITDKGYLKHEKVFRKQVADQVECPMLQVESDVVIPVTSASNKEEYAAHTIRKKIHNKLSEYLNTFTNTKLNKTLSKEFLDNIQKELGPEIDLNQPTNDILKNLNIDKSVNPVSSFVGGENAAHEIFENFLENKLKEYLDKRNDTKEEACSNLSPYLHFGQVSPLYLALKTYEFTKDYYHDFLEQLIVRRELSFNFVYYNQDYDSLDSLPTWALETLNAHREDKRQVYSISELELPNTHDEYFNACQMELLKSGKIHGYFRMYWGKKIIQWSNSPEEALNRLIYFNDKYALDGRDPNGYANILWCFGKHDRPFKERRVFGKVRYMSEKALKRNSSPKHYIAKFKTYEQ